MADCIQYIFCLIHQRKQKTMDTGQRWENMKQRSQASHRQSTNQKNICATTKNPEQQQVLEKMQENTILWRENELIPTTRSLEPTQEPPFMELEGNFMEEHKASIKHAWEKYVSTQQNYLDEDKQIKEEQTLEETLNQLENYHIFHPLQLNSMKEMFSFQPDWLRIFNGLHKIFDTKFHEEIDYLIFTTLKMYKQKSISFIKPLSLESIQHLSKNILKPIISACSEKLEAVTFSQKFDEQKENFLSFLCIFVETICCAAAGFFVNRRCGEQISLVKSTKAIKKKSTTVRHRRFLSENQQSRKRRKVLEQ